MKRGPTVPPAVRRGPVGSRRGPGGPVGPPEGPVWVRTSIVHQYGTIRDPDVPSWDPIRSNLTPQTSTPDGV